MSDRDQQITAFLDGAGWGSASRVPLAGDASFRRYERLTTADGRHAVLMDAPPPMEDVRPFVRIADHLVEIGYSAPQVLAADTVDGLVLLEDLGDDTYTRVLAAGGDETELYSLAVDLLIDLHDRPGLYTIPDGLAPYDEQRLLDEANLFTDWYLPAILEAPLEEAVRQAWIAAWKAVLPAVFAATPTLVLRDYHVDNLIWLPERPGIAACGLLDFQDAVAGPAAYDLMSLLEDARRDLGDDLVAAMRQRYAAAFPALDTEAFDAVYAILGAQRHAKVIGIFTRLCRRDGKPIYLEHIPRVWRLFERSLRHPALQPVAAWIDRHVAEQQRRIPPCPDAPQ